MERIRLSEAQLERPNPTETQNHPKNVQRKKLTPAPKYAVRSTGPKLVEGNQVRLRWWPDRTGKIVRLGAEVSEIKLDHDGTARFYMNEHLEVL